MSKDEIVEMILQHCFQEIDDEIDCAESYGHKHSRHHNRQFAKAILSKWSEAATQAAAELESREYDD